MNTLIRAEAPASKQSKGLEVIKSTHLKTITRLEIRMDKADRATTDYQAGSIDDLAVLALEGSPITKYEWMVEGAPALGRFVNRSGQAFGKIGVTIEELPWEAEAGTVKLRVKDGTGNDFPYLVETLIRLALRSSRVAGYTQHPLTLYDLKQTIGLVHDVKQELDGAADLASWFDIREMSVLEEVKATKKAAKAKEKAKAKPKEKAKAKPKPKAKAKPKASEGNAASLANLS